MSKRAQATEGPSGMEALPLSELHFTITPTLVRSLIFAHRRSARAGALRFSFYALRALQLETTHLRIAEMVAAAGRSVSTEDVARVAAGDLLPPRRHAAMEWIRQATTLCDAVKDASARLTPTSAELCAAYFEFTRGKPLHWAGFVGTARGAKVTATAKKMKVPVGIAKLYRWIEGDELVSVEPILRAATLYWGLEPLCVDPRSRLARLAVLDHELQAGLDHRALLVLQSTEFGPFALRPSAPGFAAAEMTADLTRYFETFAHSVGQALRERTDELEGRQDNEELRPWLTVRPPDELDRELFDIVQRLGSARTQQVLEHLKDPPPLRTLQRRLRHLCNRGLLAKHGTRRDAFYRLAESGG